MNVARLEGRIAIGRAAGALPAHHAPGRAERDLRMRFRGLRTCRCALHGASRMNRSRT
jgi:hypothetical protein